MASTTARQAGRDDRQRDRDRRPAAAVQPPRRLRQHHTWLLVRHTLPPSITTAAVGAAVDERLLLFLLRPAQPSDCYIRQFSLARVESRPAMGGRLV